MAPAYVNRVRFATATAGTGTLTVGTAVPGFQTPATAGLPTGTVIGYTIEDGANWETGVGTYTASGTTVSRDAVESSSAAGAKITCSGSATVFLTLTAAQLASLTTGPAADTSLDLNFLAGTLDSRITLTRAAGGATYFDSTGTLQLATANAPRFDYDPLTLLPRGLLIEETRTNGIRNPRAAGASAGTPGTLPTNWTTFGSAGLSTAVVGSGTVSGIPYLDFRVFGTATSSTWHQIQFEATQVIAAVNGQTWTQSQFVAVQAGSTTNVSSFSHTGGVQNSSGVNQTNFLSSFLSPTAVLSRFNATATIATVGAAFVTPAVQLNFSTGGAVDITLRVGAPQMELGAFATSVILPAIGAPAASTRAADVATMPAGTWFNAAAGTLDAEAMLSALNPSGGFGHIAGFNDGTTNNQIVLLNNPSGDVEGYVTTAGTPISTSALNVAAGAVFKDALAWNSSGFVRALNGQAYANTVFAIPAGITLLGIGKAFSPVAGAVYIRRLRYWPRALSSAELQQVTGLSPAITNVPIDQSPIGASVPSSGAFTTLSASSTVSGAGIVALHAAPGPIGNTTPSTGAFTALSASGLATLSAGSLIAAVAAGNRNPGHQLWTDSAFGLEFQNDGSGTPYSTSLYTRVTDGTIKFGSYAYNATLQSAFVKWGQFQAGGLLNLYFGLTVAGTATLPTVNIDGGSIDATAIGATTPSTGAFTTLSASGAVSGAGITALLAAPGPIGSTTPSTGAFTTLNVSASANLGINVFIGTNAGIASALVLNGAAGNTKIIQFQTGGVTRWQVNGVDGTAETGANAGSNWSLSSITDAGTLLGTPLSIVRATGAVTLTGALSVAGTVSGAGITALLAPYATPALLGVISIGVSGNVTLTVGQCQAAFLYFYGTLTGNITITLPVATTLVRTWIVSNVTTGGFSLTLQGAGGGTITLPAGATQPIWSDGGGLYNSVSVATITSGAINGATIGATTPSTGAFTTLSASGAVSGAGITALHAAPGPIGSTTASTGAFTTLSASSTVSGTGFSTYLASPPAIGGTAAAAGAFTTLAASGAVSGAGITALHAAPGPIGSTTPSTAAFTTLSASSTVSGTGFSAYLASPPAIGGTAAAAGAFTTLSATGLVSTRSNGGTGAALIAQAAGNVAITLYDTAAAVDAKKYDILASAGTVHFRLLNDAEAASNDWLWVARSGYAITSVNLVGAAITLTGAATVTGTLSVSSTVSGAGITALHAAPGPIGSTTASTGAFTTLSASSTVSGTGFSAYLASPPAIGGTAAAAGTFTTLSASGAVSGAGITALHAAPGPIGSTTASTGAFTTLSASSTVSGAGITALHAAPGPIGSTTPSTGAFTTLSASSTVSGTGFSAYLASPPAIGSTTPSTGAFSTLSATSTVSGTGFTTRFSAPGPIGNTTASTGAFTGISFGSAVAASSIDVSRHIALYGSVYGFAITANRLNYNTATGAAHVFMVNGVDYLNISTVGIAITDPSAASTSSFSVTAASSNSGANIMLTGNGATPKKYIRSVNGNFGVVNNAYTAEILSLTDTGGLTTGTGIFTGGFAQSDTGCYMIQPGIQSSALAWSYLISVQCTNGVSSTGFLTVSDRRAKRDIRAISEAQGVAYVLAGKPVVFVLEGNDAPSAGFIAQDDLDAGAGREQAIGVLPDDRPAYAEATAHSSPAARLVRNYEFDNAYLTAALQNALRRIEALEQRLQ